jgi:hypothetical protein
MGGFVLRLRGKGTSCYKYELETKSAGKRVCGLGALADMKSTNLQHRLPTHMGTRTWSVRDVRRLKEGLRAGTSIPHLAAQLRREIRDVRSKIDEVTRQHLAERDKRSEEPRRRKRS